MWGVAGGEGGWSGAATQQGMAALHHAIEQGWPADFIEIYVSAPIEVCEARDPKGHYRRARDNQLLRLSGIDSRYEEPENPELVVDTSAMSASACVERIVDYVWRGTCCDAS